MNETEQTPSDANGDGRRFRYEVREYGENWVTKPQHRTLAGAIEEMAADGWRFVGATDNRAVFERPA